MRNFFSNFVSSKLIDEFRALNSKMTSKENLSSDNLPIYLLKTLEERGTFDSNALAAELNLDHQKLVGALKSLQITPNVSFIIFFVKL